MQSGFPFSTAVISGVLSVCPPISEIEVDLVSNAAVLSPAFIFSRTIETLTASQALAASKTSSVVEWNPFCRGKGTTFRLARSTTSTNMPCHACCHD